MKFLTDIVQGSEAWHKIRAQYFTASEAPAMLGLSKYTKRSELLRQKATGETPEVTSSQQRLFDKGHAMEEAARPVAEAFMGEELYPATITNEVEGLNLLASMDGLTMLGDKGWEHKMFNAEFAAQVKAGDVPDTHWPQLEHQMLVSQCESILFTVSDGTEEKREQVWYQSVPERRKQVLDGWKQFAKDLQAYTPEAEAEVVEALPVRELPAIRYEMNGLALSSNLEAYKQAATELVELSQAELESDQDFADAEARQKIFTKAEMDIASACDRVMGEIDSIDTFVKDMRFISEQIRQARLAEAKQIKKRKDELRNNILTAANQQIQSAVCEAEKKVNATLPAINANVFEAMKGKRTLESLKDAADGEVANAKIQINALVEIAMGNALHLSTAASDYKFLFNDWNQIAFKACEDFKALVTARIAEHKEREANRKQEESAKQAENPATYPMKEEVTQAQAPEKETYRPGPSISRGMSAMEINAIVQFVAWVKTEAAATYADDLQQLSQMFINEKSKEAA